jgi:putative oxidoreductase
MRRFFPVFVSGWGAAALLLVRVAMGVAFILHGWPKIQNPTSWMTAMGGEDMPSFLQALAALAEFGGGIALVLGLLTPLAALGIVCQMLGALFLVHFPRGDPFVRSGGPSYELPLIYLVLAILLIVVGPGRWSLDALLFGRNRAATQLGS